MGTPVGLRASKEEFMHAIDLDARNHDHDRWYQAMRVRPPFSLVSRRISLAVDY